MEHGDNVVVLIERKFDSFEEFSHLAVSWDADFRQMDSERFKSTMFQAQIGDLLISSARLGCHVEQHGATPVGMRTFAVPDVGSPDLYWFGHTVGQHSLLSFPTHREIDVFSRPGFCGLTFSVPESSLLSLFESKGFHEPEKVLDHDEQVFLGRSILINRLRYLLRVVTPEVAKIKKAIMCWPLKFKTRFWQRLSKFWRKKISNQNSIERTIRCYSNMLSIIFILIHTLMSRYEYPISAVL